MKYLALCLTVASALFLSSCASPDGFIRCGTFGPGQPEQYQRITGLPGQHTFHRSVVIDPGCRTGQPGIFSQSGIIRYPVPMQHGCYPQQGWQQTPSMMPPHLPQYPNRAGVINDCINQPRWCPPMGHPEPMVYNPYTRCWEPRRCR